MASRMSSRKRRLRTTVFRIGAITKDHHRDRLMQLWEQGLWISTRPSAITCAGSG